MSKFSEWRKKHVRRRDVVFGTAVAAAAGTAGYLSPGVVDFLTNLLPLLLLP